MISEQFLQTNKQTKDYTSYFNKKFRKIQKQYTVDYFYYCVLKWQKWQAGALTPRIDAGALTRYDNRRGRGEPQRKA